MIPAMLAAQGIHYSQMYQQPSFISAGNAGGYQMLGLQNRTQWNQVSGNKPYRTFSFYGDTKFAGLKNHQLINQDWIGMGFSFNHDYAGDGNLAVTTGAVFLSYHFGGNHLQSKKIINHTFKELKKYLHLGLGVGFGFYNLSLRNHENLSFETQWTGYVFDFSTPSGEPLNYTGLSQFGYCGYGGFSLDFQPPETPLKIELAAGYELYPDISFYELPSAGFNNRLQLFASVRYDMFSLYYYQQRIKSRDERSYGLNVFYPLKDGYALIGGVGFRQESDFLTLIGLKMKTMLLTVGYDIQQEIPVNESFKGHTSSLEIAVIKYFQPGNLPIGFERKQSDRGYKNRKPVNLAKEIANLCDLTRDHYKGEIENEFAVLVGLFESLSGSGLNYFDNQGRYYAIIYSVFDYQGKYLAFGAGTGLEKIGPSVSVQVVPKMKVLYKLPGFTLFQQIGIGYRIGYFMPVGAEMSYGMHGYLMDTEFGLNLQLAPRKILTLGLYGSYQPLHTSFEGVIDSGRIYILGLRLSYQF